MKHSTVRHKNFPVVLLPILLAGCVGGVYHQPYYPPEHHPRPPAQIQPYTPAKAYDQETAERIRRYLASDPRVGAETLLVRVEDGVALLSGNAKSPEAATLAVRMTERVPGVHKVINTMNVH